ncbi:hypothetical protein AA313_de0209717 [Arthrobotrys entomopaga]|nr:hypothetical protein AA313_de0209717 [Arthrobotrys entomopaga]
MQNIPEGITDEELDDFTNLFIRATIQNDEGLKCPSCDKSVSSIAANKVRSRAVRYEWTRKDGTSIRGEWIGVNQTMGSLMKREYDWAEEREGLAAGGWVIRCRRHLEDLEQIRSRVEARIEIRNEGWKRQKREQEEAARIVEIEDEEMRDGGLREDDSDDSLEEGEIRE